jgi:hypothetical protein
MKAGYPQHLWIILGIAKSTAAVVMLLPGFGVAQGMAYAGVAFAWVMAIVATTRLAMGCRYGVLRWCANPSGRLLRD